MKERSRMKNSFFNLVSGFVSRILGMLTAFVVRTIFIQCLNADYLSVNGLYTSILSMLSLAELGFGTAMVYSMYKPLAKEDTKKLNQLMLLYKKVYNIIGGIILIIGVCLIPFLDYFIKNTPNISGLKFYYLLFLLNSVVSYWFFAYKNSLLQADQKAYIVNNYISIFNVIKSIIQTFLLIIYHNYTLYLLTQILCTIGQNIFISIQVNRTYQFLKEKTIDKLSKKETKEIFKDVKALALSKISHVILNSTDNIIISSFVGFKWVGLLSNFTLITDAVTSMLCQITSSLTGSLGNFIAKESKENSYILFKRIEFLNYWLYGFSTISLIILLNPFIMLWIGKEYVLSDEVVVVLSINFFIAGFMNTLWTFRSTLGLFTQGQYRPLIVSLINIFLSIALSFIWKVAGVLIGTTISRACVNLWYDPWLIHNKGFKKPVKPFFIEYLFRRLLLIFITIILKMVSLIVFDGVVTVLNFVVMLIITIIITNIIFIVVYYKYDEFKYFYNLISNFVNEKINF